MIKTSDLTESNTLEGLVKSEYLLAHTASERYGVYYFHARETTVFLSKCITSIDIIQENFARFLSYTKKHHLLAVLSTIRLHKVQAFMNLRHVLEAGSWAAYAIANTDDKHFIEREKDGTLRITDKLPRRRNAWLDKNFPDASEYIKTQKDRMNNTIAHAGLVYTETVFDIDREARSFDMPFFDKEDIFHVNSDLWLTAAIGIALMNLFYGVKDRCGGMFEFATDFEERFQALGDQNAVLQHELQNSGRYREIDERHREAQAKA